MAESSAVMHVIARIHTDFPEKFGVPRQSGLVDELREKFPAGLLGVLENDPRPRYQDDPKRVYGLSFGGWNVRFRVAGEELTVLAMERADGGKEQR